MTTPNLEQWAAWLVDSAETDREFAAMLESVGQKHVPEPAQAED